jgi:hypothetical protein
MAKEHEWSNETLTTKMKLLCKSVSDLKKLRPITWGAVVLFSVLVAIGLGIRMDVKDANARVEGVREMHVKEYRDLGQAFENKIDSLEANMNKTLFTIGVEIGRNKESHIEITSKLNRIEEKLDQIADWQREHR